MAVTLCCISQKQHVQCPACVQNIKCRGTGTLTSEAERLFLLFCKTTFLQRKGKFFIHLLAVSYQIIRCLLNTILLLPGGPASRQPRAGKESTVLVCTRLFYLRGLRKKTLTQLSWWFPSGLFFILLYSDSVLSILCSIFSLFLYTKISLLSVLMFSF